MPVSLVRVSSLQTVGTTPCVASVILSRGKNDMAPDNLKQLLVDRNNHKVRRMRLPVNPADVEEDLLSGALLPPPGLECVLTLTLYTNLLTSMFTQNSDVWRLAHVEQKEQTPAPTCGGAMFGLSHSKNSGSRLENNTVALQWVALC